MNDTATPCGNATVYCVGGAGSPTGVPTGWYSTPEVADGTNRTGVASCVPGEYCVAGLRHNCSGGTYSALPGQTSCAECPAGEKGMLMWVQSLCVGVRDETARAVSPCALPGFACPEATGTLSYIVHGCSVPTAFCPARSTGGTPTPPGSYALINPLGLFAHASVCEAGRCVRSFGCCGCEAYLRG